MAEVFLNGTRIVYEEMGSGLPVVLTPEARYSRDRTRLMAETLMKDHRVIIWDRPNCGESDVLFEGGSGEYEVWAEYLHLLLETLDALPAYVGGPSAGCRTSLHFAVQYPQDVRGLLLSMVADYRSNPVIKRGQQLYGQYAETAREGGMEAIAATPYYAERIQENERNERRILDADPADFISTIERWHEELHPDPPSLGPGSSDLASIEAPAVIVSGDDPMHTAAAAERLQGLLKHSELHQNVVAPELWRRMMSSEETFSTIMLRISEIYGAFMGKLESDNEISTS